MPHAIDCPACGGHMKVPDGIWDRRIAGQLSHLVCKKCKHNIEIDDRQGSGNPTIKETVPPPPAPEPVEAEPKPEPKPAEAAPLPAAKPAEAAPTTALGPKPAVVAPKLALPKPQLTPKPVDTRGSKPQISPKPVDTRGSKPEILSKPADVRASRPEITPKPADVRQSKPELSPKPVEARPLDARAVVKPVEARQTKPDLPKVPLLRQSTPDTPVAKLTGPRASATETPLPAQPLPRFPPPKPLPLKDADIRATRPDREPPPKPKALKDAAKPSVIREADSHHVASAPPKPRSEAPKKSERPKTKSEAPKTVEEKRRSVRPVALDSEDTSSPATAVESSSAGKGRGLTIAALVLLIAGAAWWFLFRPTGETSSIQPRTEPIQSRAPAPTAPPPPASTTAKEEPQPPPAVESATPALGSATPDASRKPARRKRPVSWPEKRYVPSSI